MEFTELKQAKAQFDVNFFGTVNVSRAVLPSMRRQHSGHIVNISSVAAVAHIPFQAFYSASNLINLARQTSYVVIIAIFILIPARLIMK